MIHNITTAFKSLVFQRNDMKRIYGDHKVDGTLKLNNCPKNSKNAGHNTMGLITINPFSHGLFGH